MKAHELLPVIALALGFYFHTAILGFAESNFPGAVFSYLNDLPKFQFAVLLFTVSYIVLATLHWVKHRSIDTTTKVTLGLIILLAIPGILMKDSNLFKWKTTIIFWLISGFLFITQLMNKESTTISKLFTGKINAPLWLWRRITWAAASFFLVIGAINLLVAVNFNEEVWINFKLFGVTALFIGFFLVFMPHFFCL